VRVHLAGTSPLTTAAKLDRAASVLAGHPWRLVSFMDLQASMREVEAVEDPESMIVDSGLFALMFGAKRGSMPATFEAYRDYTRKYLDTLDRAQYRGLLVECDTHKLLGMDATFRLREEFAALGDRVIYTWHAPEGIEGLVELARTRSYIALSVPELRVFFGGTFGTGSRQQVAAVWGLLRKIHDACSAGPPRIHLLGCTAPSMMQTELAWSCDSTSWLSGVRYGKAWVYEGNGKLVMRLIRSPEFARWKAACAARFTPELAELASRTSYAHDELACAMAYADYQSWLDTRFSARSVREYSR